MALLLTCPQGDSVTCAILEVAKAFSSGPSAFAVWATLIIPLFAALASTAVAIVSVTIAKKARDIAEASEAARVSAEDTRVVREQQQRLDVAIRDLFVAIANLIRDLEQYDSDMHHWMRNWSNGARKAQLPSDAGLLAHVAAARLEASTESERLMLDELSRAVLALRNQTTSVRRAWLENSWSLVVKWRHASEVERPKVLAEFGKVEAAKTAEAAEDGGR